MYRVSLLLAMSLVIVGAAVAIVVGVGRFNRRTGLERSFVGEALLMVAWVFPEILIASYALILAGRVPTHPGDPYIVVGAIVGSAAANVLLIGVLNTVWPGRGGLEVALAPIQGSPGLACHV
jgi:Ca2+/Na+ antiporter